MTNRTAIWTPRALVTACILAACLSGRSSGAENLAVYQLGAGWATFGLALPPGAAKTGVQVGSLPTQTDVKTTWPDESIRFAIVTARVDKPAAYAIVPGDKPAGVVAPTWPEATVQLIAGGQTWTASLPRAMSDLWLNGPLVREARATVTPAAGAAHHPFLRVVFDVRAYADGGVRLDVTVENVLDKAGASAVTYDVTIAADGQTVWTKRAVTHAYLARWRKVFPLRGLREAELVPDLEPAHAARALPRFMPGVSTEVNSPTGAQFDILQAGALNPDMHAHGGRPELAPYPDWTARYLVHRDQTQRQFVLAHGTLAGSWPIHLREPEGGRYSGLGPGRLVSIDERNTFWIDGRAPAQDRPAGTGGGLLSPDNAHVPSLGFVPYLLTGDRYHADEMTFWANYALLASVPDKYSGGFVCRGETPDGSRGLLHCNEVRGIAWVLRNLADTAAYLPDGDPAKAYLAGKVSNNLAQLDAIARRDSTPLGTLFHTWYRGSQRRDGSRTVGIATWENNYLAWAIDRVNALGFPGGSLMRDTLVRWQLRLFTSGDDFPRQYAANSVYEVGVLENPQNVTGPVRFWGTLRQLFEENGLRGTPPNRFDGYYGVDIRLTLMIAVALGWSGAQDAYDFVTPQIMSDLARRSGWAIARDDRLVRSSSAAPGEPNSHP